MYDFQENEKNRITYVYSNEQETQNNIVGGEIKITYLLTYLLTQVERFVTISCRGISEDHWSTQTKNYSYSTRRQI